MNLFSLPVRRPVATAMFFLAVLLLGVVAWQRIPVELFPTLTGNELNVTFYRPGSDPEVVEREILMPLEARVAELAEVEETSAEIRGSGGYFRVAFKLGSDLKVRELELSRLASELTRAQPRGTTIRVELDPFSRMSQANFAMYLQVTGLDDRNALLDFVDERIVPRLAAVPGLASVQTFGGAPREVTVRVDPDRCAAVGVRPDQVTATLARSVRRLDFVGGAEDEGGRTAVVLDGRPRGVTSLGELRLSPSSPALLRHVADIELGVGREEGQYRVNGMPAVGMIMFQEEDANLIALTRGLRQRIDRLREEFREYGIDFVINFDGGEVIDEQLDRLKKLALSGFLIALAVLFLFLRQIRAVAVVGVAVPASLLSALALLYLFGQSINIITLFGLALGIGMLVDNSIVVYEAVQRQLEQGADPDRATEYGVRRTARAILAATLTNAVVFIPISFAEFESGSARSLVQVLVLAILLPLAGSVLVAVGLVPLLARRLAAPAALARLATLRRRRELLGGWRPPDRIRALFSGVLTAALRRPGAWVIAVAAAVLLTAIIAVPWVAVGTASQEAPQATMVQMAVEIATGGSMERATGAFARLEQAALAVEGVERVETFAQEEGGTVTVHLPPEDERPKELDADRVRAALRTAARELEGVELTAPSMSGRGGGGGGGGDISGVMGQGPAEVVISGPDARELQLLAEDVRAQLESVPEINFARVASRSGRDELRVIPDDRRLAGFGLTGDQVLPALALMPREGVPMRTGFTLRDGREIPLTVRRAGEGGRARQDLLALRLATAAGVVPLGAVADVRRMPPPPTILHKNGRREVSVLYTFGADVPQTGPERIELDEQIKTAIQGVHRPAGYTLETSQTEDSSAWLKGILISILLLLFAVLALTLESLTLPLLVLLALPLTLLGATWGLVLTDLPLDRMAQVGAVALIGLTVNPAILLVDRMQQRAWFGGRSAGAAALAAVRERARPVLMTTATTVAGLWPLALVTGRQNEIWPPFATVVMGGLITSTLLTLLVIPVGFVFLNRLDRLFGRLGPWIVLGWAGATAAIMTPLIVGEVISTLTWQIVTTVLVAAILLGVAVLALRRPDFPEPERSDGGPPEVEVRYLHKIYGLPGPIGRAWRIQERFAKRVLDFGGRAFDPRSAAGRILSLALVFSGTLYLALSFRTVFWQCVFALAAAVFFASLLKQLRRARGRADAMGRVDPGGAEGAAAFMAPWAALAYIVLKFNVLPWVADERVQLRLWVPIAIAVVILIVQLGRRTAVLVSRGDIPAWVQHGFVKRPRTYWRRISRRVFGLDLPREQVHALGGVQFIASQGMVGILGPNGAGKTTLLRMLAGILDPTLGTIHLGGVALPRLRRYLARYVGYLPQDFGLPDNLTAREYLDYYALLYEIEPQSEREQRVTRLLEEVGLGKRSDEKIGSFSGGMRQRVAVARTLLRLPPVIIVDEPTVGLDPRERIRFRNLLAKLAEGRVVLFSTHVVEDVEVACERVIVLARGKVVFDGEPSDLALEAKGRTWVVSLPEGAESTLREGAMVVDQVPEGDGTLRSRVLAESTPHDAAQSVAPTLEDGYLWLVGLGVEI
jgi:multidrug efflux pump subunit AcrB/ABC-type multidrug transport system ATPase subunit